MGIEEEKKLIFSKLKMVSLPIFPDYFSKTRTKKKELECLNDIGLLNRNNRNRNKAKFKGKKSLLIRFFMVAISILMNRKPFHVYTTWL